MTPSRRGFLTGLVSLLAAPAVVRVESLMAIRAPALITGFDLGEGDATVIYAYDPSRRTILTINQITREAVRLFKNSNQFLKEIDQRCREELEFARGAQWNAPPIGTKLRIRLPSDYSSA